MPSFRFGPHAVDVRHVFHSTPLSLAFVNLRPALPGHVLVVPRRVAPRLDDLSDAEAADLFLAARAVGRALSGHYRATALTVSVQDGPHAGQSVPHAHFHVIPRVPADLERNDEIYDRLYDADARAVPPRAGAGVGEGAGAAPAAGRGVAPDVVPSEQRRSRGEEEMAAEAAVFAALPGMAGWTEG